MTDDELIERVRRTLENQAAAITPAPPGQETASYPAHGPVPRLRERWPLVLAAAAVAAAVGLAAAYWPGGGRARIGIVSPSSPTTVGATTASTAAPNSPVTAGGVAVPPTASAPVTTAPAASTVPETTRLPARFAPQSVTFVSANEGWVAGTAPCASGSCVALGRTLDGGRTWGQVPAPRLRLADGGYPGAEVTVRFADARDGWIYGGQSGSFWSTHDGGMAWHRVAIPGLSPDATIMAMETSARRVQVAMITAGRMTIQVATSPVSTDSWVAADTGIGVGAGPVPGTQLVLQKAQGWILENDRTVVGGARLTRSGGWGPWTPPCQTANGAAALAASTPTDVVAVCQEGAWGPARNLPAGAATPSTWLFRSSDGGATFQAVGAIPGGAGAVPVASPVPATVVVGTQGSNAASLLASFDAGRTWQAVYRNPQVQVWSYLGFTTLTQGVAIGSAPGGTSVLVMTRDGGHSWTAVSF